MTQEKILAPLRRACVAGFLLALAGCGSIGPGPTPQLYVLNPQMGALPDAPKVTWQLVVAQPVVAESLDTERIALTRGVSVDYYANSAWGDRTPSLVQGALVEAFDKSGRIAAVARDTEGLRGDYQLQTELKDFSAHYDTQDGAPSVVVRIVAKMVFTQDRQIIATLDSSHSAQAVANNLPAVVAAFNEALAASMEEIAGWALRVPVAAAPIAATPEPVPPAPTPRHHRHHRHRD